MIRLKWRLCSLLTCCHDELLFGVPLIMAELGVNIHRPQLRTELSIKPALWNGPELSLCPTAPDDVSLLLIGPQTAGEWGWQVRCNCKEKWNPHSWFSSFSLSVRALKGRWWVCFCCKFIVSTAVNLLLLLHEIYSFYCRKPTVSFAVNLLFRLQEIFCFYCSKSTVSSPWNILFLLR